MTQREPSSTSATVQPLPIGLIIRGLSFVLTLTSMLVGLHWYLGLRLIAHAHWGEPWSSLAWSVLWGFLAAVFAGFIGGRIFPRPVAKVAQWVGFGWMGAFGLLLVATALSDALLYLGSLGTDVTAWHSWRAPLVLSTVAPALAWGFWIARRPIVKRVSVAIEGLDASLDGFRLVQISDVHIGETLGRDFAQSVTAQVNALSADAVFVTGDLVDGSVEKLADEVAPFASLRATHGVFYVTGNHEYYHGGAAWEAEVRRLGLIVLHNEHRVIANGKLVVGGVPDVEGARFSSAHAPDIGMTFSGAPIDVPRILLAHQPRFAKAAQGAKVSLMVSGHTHAGQIFPFMFFVKLQQPVVAGLRKLHGVLTYTSPGTGYWGPPFRVGTRGEITEITLRRTAPTS